MDLLNFLKVLLRRMWLILAVTLLAVTATWIATRNKPQLYKSTAKISTGITDKSRIGENEAWIQMEVVDNQFANILKAMTSRQAVSLLSYKLIQHDLNHNDPFKDLSELKRMYAREALVKADCVITAHYRAIEPLSNEKQDALPQELLQAASYDYESLIAQLQVGREERSDYIQVSFRSANPKLSAFVVNTFAEEFIRYFNTQKGAGADQQIANLKIVSDQKRAEMEQFASALMGLQSQYGIIEGANEAQSVVDMIYSYEKDMVDARQRIPSLEAELAELNKKLGNDNTFKGYNDPGDNPQILELQDEIKRLQSRQINSGGSNSALRDSIEMLREQRDIMMKAGRAGTASANVSEMKGDLMKRKLNLELELARARQSADEYARKAGELRGRKGRITQGNSALGKTLADYELAKSEYEAAFKRYNDALDATVDLRKRLKMFEYGTPAQAPEPSQTPLLIMLSGLVSLSLCVVAIFLLEYVDLSIKSPSQFQKLSGGLPLIGVLNHLNAPSLKLEALFSDRSANPSMEKYKQLLRKLRFEILNSGAKTVLFTSSQSGQGKSLTMISLAYSLSLNGRRVLLIDTNFKTASLTHMLQARPVLEDWIGRDGTLAEAITRSEFNGIDVVGCLGGDYSPAEVLYPDRFREMIAGFSQDYDHIFLEGASLNTYSDTKELSNFVEKVIAVFSASAVIRQPDKDSIAFLQSLGDKFAGAVLNDVELQNLEM